MSITYRRLAALISVATLSLGAVACSDSEGANTPDARATSAPDTDSAAARASAEWLTGQLTDGVIHNPASGGFTDYGLSIDTALALDAVGGMDDTVAEITDAVAAGVESYTTGADFGTDDVYAGSTAKAAVLAISAERDPSDFGGTDLVKRLEGLVAADAPIRGRLEDDSATDDYANVLGQAFAARALVEADSDRAADVVDFLLAQQCEAGFFRLDFTADKSAGDQSCDAARPEEPPADTTALVAVILDPVASEDPDLAAALDAARTWMLGQQAEDGSFSGGTDTVLPNANSTGLAGWALGELDEPTAAGAAAEWLRELQVTEDECDALAAEAGAVAFDPAALEAGCADGITDETRDQWRRTTA